MRVICKVIDKYAVTKLASSRCTGRNNKWIIIRINQLMFSFSHIRKSMPLSSLETQWLTCLYPIILLLCEMKLLMHQTSCKLIVIKEIYEILIRRFCVPFMRIGHWDDLNLILLTLNPNINHIPCLITVYFRLVAFTYDEILILSTYDTTMITWLRMILDIGAEY